jgi:hypothetical protein
MGNDSIKENNKKNSYDNDIKEVIFKFTTIYSAEIFLLHLCNYHLEEFCSPFEFLEGFVEIQKNQNQSSKQ